MAVISGSEELTKGKMKKGKSASSPAKRNNCPGVRLVGGRIYDSVQGKTCHQCRQKTMDFMVGCKNMGKDKPCPMHLCHKCLLNRKKRGCEPTGQLVRTAKATGYSSVSDLLQIAGINNNDQIKSLKDMNASWKKINTSKNEESIVSSENSGKENCIEEVIDINVNPLDLPKNPSDKQSAGCKRKKVNEKPDDTLSKDNVVNELDGPHDGEKKQKKLMQGQLESEFDSKRGAAASAKETLSEESQDFTKNKEVSLRECSVKDNTLAKSDLCALTPLPQGTGVTAIGDIDLQSEDILDIKKGQPEAVLRDIMQGRSSRRGKCSLTIQFLNNLLSSLKGEEEERFSAETSTEGKNSWYAELKMLISESPSVSRTMGLHSLGNDVEEFENLNPSEKLKILNFICDEILETAKIRDWMDNQNSKFAEKAKEAKEKVTAAKDEEKRLKKKMQDEIAQAIIAKNGAPFSISEHDAIVSQIKHETAEAHACVVESQNTRSKYNKNSEAVRTEPFFSGTDGNVYWRLKCYGDKSILLSQDVGAGNTAASDEKWFAFDVEQKEIIEKRINYLRLVIRNGRGISVVVDVGFNMYGRNNAEFFENIYPYKTRHEQFSGGPKRPRDEPSENVHNEENPRHSTRQRTSTSFGLDFVTFLLENEPQTFKEAMVSSDSSFWKEAVNSKIDSILSNHTWELVDLPPGNKPLGSKWIFKRKMKVSGIMDKYKARLVVKGFKQKESLDYFDTYSPVIRITSIRMLIALAAVYGFEIHQMDVKTAVLNGELEEEIYMEQPEGFVVLGKENKVCKLIKSLYGLKQAPKQWHSKFDQTMLANGFKINECDKCVYIKDTPNHQVIVCLSVDDMLIISRDIFDINATKRMLESKFDMKDVGVADVILGIRIHRTSQGLTLS
ncbi:putative tyrosyl-DNA phosphodiesterase 2-like [Capsicum annuum]|nr:putative tyrosyl-DNA phosphodiesterase 2-like [Capsicum annuum]KAF3673861.1 putative tyrosyl-DNA phosphodiesterase 2-like [Capsicum annuum]